MNLILFEPSELPCAQLPRTDPRAVHILDVLRRRPGERFDAGIVSGPRGKATLVTVSEASLTLLFAWEPPRPELPRLQVVLGLARPQTARKLLQELTTLGATALDFVTTERCDVNYASSSLWSSGEWRRHLLAGAEQAFDTRIPAVTWDRSLRQVASHPSAALRIALDNYEAAHPLAVALSSPPADARHLASPAVTLAFGPERGWGPDDRAILREQGFRLAHLGERVLRTETAAVAAVAILRSTYGWP